MKNRIMLTTLLLAIFAGTSGLADDIGLITISSRQDAATAEQILGRASDRPAANQYLVTIDQEQRLQLEAAGLAFEPLLADVADPESYLIVSSDNPKRPSVNLRSMASASLGLDRYLIAGGRATARSLERESGIWTRPATERDIYIRYIPSRVATSISAALRMLPDSLADRVSIDSMASYVQRLEDFHTRYIGTDSNSAAIDWMAQKFADFGYTDITFPEFQYQTLPLDNVMVVKEGYAEPEKIIVIGGHFDSITYSQQTSAEEYAPGADDNATGTALTMEMARILADIPLRKTVIFMPFNAEEVGLVGSRAAAQQFRADGANIEVMLNYDMVAHDDVGARQLDLSSNASAYWNVAADVASRVTNLDIVQTIPGSSSDHASFMSQGFDVIDHIETDFNYAGWHTDVDHLDSLNMPFYEHVGRMAAVTLAYIADAAAPGLIERIVDIGNGSSLEVVVQDCQPDYTYSIRWGTGSGTYTDSISLGTGECSGAVTGLTEGTTYYFTVVGYTPDGNRSIFAEESFEMPLSVPRAPADLVGDPQSNANFLHWRTGIEADISHYNLYRTISPVADPILYAGGVTDTSFTDMSVRSGVAYFYQLTAVDLDGHESAKSPMISITPATFDGGILLADESNSGTGLPAQEIQDAYFDTLFDGLAHYVYPIEESSDALTRNLMGQYSSAFYIDDDFVDKYWDFSEDTLAWFIDNPTNFFVAGHGILWHTESSQTLPDNSFFKQEFLINSYESNYSGDFLGAHGQNGWPSVAVQPGRGPSRLGFIQKIAADPAAEVIYTFDSYTDSPDWEGMPCGVAIDGPNGKRVFLAFPLYYLQPLQAQELIQHATAWFGESQTELPTGDVNGDNVVNMADATMLVLKLFFTFEPFAEPNQADVNADCRISLSDITYFINYLFYDGPVPVPGCVE